MLKTPFILLFGTGFLLTALCSDSGGYGSPSSTPYEQNFDDSVCDGSQYEDYYMCGPNEEYSDCVNGGCERRECVDLRKPEVCIEPAEGYCIEGCVCTKGYLRNSEGDCVPINFCPERRNKQCRGRNEYYENCRATPRARKSCACDIGCRCVIGYVRNKEGKCVLNTEQFTTTTPKPPTMSTTTPKPTTMTTTTPKPITTTTPASNKNSSENSLDELLKANKMFTGKFIQYEIENSKESFIASPFSVLYPLGLIARFAKGGSLEELLKFLNLNDQSEIQGAFTSLSDYLSTPKNVTLILGQKAYADKKYPLNSKLLESSEAQNVDFSRSQEAADIINEWVKKLTNGLIPTLIDKGVLNALTRLVLVNAIYFKGNWLRPFDPKSTQKKDFYVTKNNTVTVNMMYQEGTFGYTENSQYKALQLFYKDRDYSLLTILPTSEDDYSLKSLVNLFDDPDVIPKIISNLKSERVRVYLPSIQTSTKTDLKTILQQYNVTEVFDPQKAEISDLLQQPQQLFISEFIQKAVIIINELGSEAAAANAGIVGITAVFQSQNFEANRPYLYSIQYKDTVLFCGRYTGEQM